MIRVILPSRHLCQLGCMTKEGASGSTVTGTGEFERKQKYVIATVELKGGVIHSVGFASDDGAVPEGSEEVVRLLVGRTVNEALEIDTNALDLDPRATYEVLFEAFYRAVETCLDPQ
jgi:hypothetical protein